VTLVRDLLLRWLALTAMAFWLGGFTFYSAFVIPILHDTMGGHDAGVVTGRVTNPLNVIGVVTIALWWLMVAVERPSTRWATWIRVGLLVVSTAILVGLILLHPIMDARLESGAMTGFYPLHQIYLNVSTVQWVMNLGLIATTLLVWRSIDSGRPRP
jgi:Domain of unknown function (DUF4149)